LNPTIIRIMRVLRIARILKILKAADGVQSLLNCVSTALPQVGNLGGLFFLIFFIFSALGIELFGKLDCTLDTCHGLDRHAHFRNFGYAMLTLFRISTGDNWSGVFKDCLNQDLCADDCSIMKYVSPLYFFFFVTTSQFVLVNVVVAVLMKQLEDSKNLAMMPSSLTSKLLSRSSSMRSPDGSRRGTPKEGSRVTLNKYDTKTSSSGHDGSSPTKRMTSPPYGRNDDQFDGDDNYGSKYSLEMTKSPKRCNMDDDLEDDNRPIIIVSDSAQETSYVDESGYVIKDYGLGDSVMNLCQKCYLEKQPMLEQGGVVVIDRDTSELISPATPTAGRRSMSPSAGRRSMSPSAGRRSMSPTTRGRLDTGDDDTTGERERRPLLRRQSVDSNASGPLADASFEDEHLQSHAASVNPSLRYRGNPANKPDESISPQHTYTNPMSTADDLIQVKPLLSDSVAPTAPQNDHPTASSSRPTSSCTLRSPSKCPSASKHRASPHHKSSPLHSVCAAHSATSLASLDNYAPTSKHDRTTPENGNRTPPDIHPLHSQLPAHCTRSRESLSKQQQVDRSSTADLTDRNNCTTKSSDSLQNAGTNGRKLSAAEDDDPLRVNPIFTAPISAGAPLPSSMLTLTNADAKTPKVSASPVHLRKTASPPASPQPSRASSPPVRPSQYMMKMFDVPQPEAQQRPESSPADTGNLRPDSTADSCGSSQSQASVEQPSETPSQTDQPTTGNNNKYQEDAKDKTSSPSLDVKKDRDIVSGTTGEPATGMNGLSALQDAGMMLTPAKTNCIE